MKNAHQQWKILKIFDYCYIKTEKISKLVHFFLRSCTQQKLGIFDWLLNDFKNYKSTHIFCQSTNWLIVAVLNSTAWTSTVTCKHLCSAITYSHIPMASLQDVLSIKRSCKKVRNRTTTPSVGVTLPMILKPEPCKCHNLSSRDDNLNVSHCLLLLNTF